MTDDASVRQDSLNHRLSYPAPDFDENNYILSIEDQTYIIGHSSLKNNRAYKSSNGKWHYLESKKDKNGLAETLTPI